MNNENRNCDNPPCYLTPSEVASATTFFRSPLEAIKRLINHSDSEYPRTTNLEVALSLLPRRSRKLIGNQDLDYLQKTIDREFDALTRKSPLAVSQAWQNLGEELAYICQVLGNATTPEEGREQLSLQQTKYETALFQLARASHPDWGNEQNQAVSEQSQLHNLLSQAAKKGIFALRDQYQYLLPSYERQAQHVLVNGVNKNRASGINLTRPDARVQA